MRPVLISLFVSGLALAPPITHAQPAVCIIETLAGGGDTPVGDGGPATDAELLPSDIAYGPDGLLYVAESRHRSIRRIGINGVIERVAGNGLPGTSPDGVASLDASMTPYRLAFGPTGDLFYTERGRVRKIAQGIVMTVAGNGSEEFSGDGGPAIEAGIGLGARIAVEADGSVLVANHFQLRRVAPNGTINTIAGVTPEDVNFFTPNGDGGPAVAAVIGQPFGLTVDSDGFIYVAGNLPRGVGRRVWRIAPQGTIEEYSFPPGTVSDLELDSDGSLIALISGQVRRFSEATGWASGPGPYSSIAVSSSGLIAALRGSQIFAVDSQDGSHLAGVGHTAHHGEGGPALAAYIEEASGVDVSADGTVFYADSGLGRLDDSIRLQPIPTCHR